MDKKDDLVILGDNIRIERLRKKWSQEYLADIAGLSQSQHVSRIESGKVDIQATTLFAILRALNCKLEDLIDLNEEKNG
ncbi:putative transcription factor Cro/Ci family [Clostridium sp. CAG:967]|nr:putative transcription factor Cro/Ci family [Clostridium sp. CAG:967]